MRALLRHRNFGRLFLSQGLSTIGDRIVFVALALYVTYERITAAAPSR